MRPRAQGTVGTVALAITAMLAGCGSTEVSSGKVEEQVRVALTPPPPVVSCPSDPHPEKGAALTCQLRYSDGDSGVLVVRETDDSGHVAVSPRDLKILTIGRAHATSVVRQLAAKNNATLRSVSCPGNTPVSDRTLTCELRDVNGLRGTITQHIRADGALSINPKRDLHVNVGSGQARGRYRRAARSR